MACKVCNSFKVGSHNHYGADCICYSCRGFFLRAVSSSYYQIFQHNPINNCIIDSKNRKSCKKCRFEKCLQVGMKIAFVQKPVPKSGKFANHPNYDQSQTFLEPNFWIYIFMLNYISSVWPYRKLNGHNLNIPI